MATRPAGTARGVRWRLTRSLARALGVGPRGVHAFVGAGGKTAAIRRLLQERPGAVATTTTHLERSGFGYGLLGVFPDTAALSAAGPELLRARPVTLALAGGLRLRSPAFAWHASFPRAHPKLLVLVEADGAARRLLKIPAAGEPAWPPGPLRRAIVVVGLAALGRRTYAVAHHPERFASGQVRGAEVRRMLAAYLEAAPPRAPLCILFTGAAGVEPALLHTLVRHCARLVRRRDRRRRDPDVPLRVVATADVASGPFQVWDFGRGSRGAPRLPAVCGVLLAAGLGVRYGAAAGGRSKLLERWRGRTLVEHAVARFAAAGFAALVVVTGHRADAICPLVRRAARRYGLRPSIVRNRAYAQGLGTSVRAGARAAPAGMGLLFGHADMPAVRLATLRRIAGTGSALVHRIVVPTVAGAPRNPAFFPAALRGALARLPASSGGKSVAAAHGDLVFHLDMGEGRDLVDIDRAADLDALQRGKRQQRRRPGRGAGAGLRVSVLLVGAGDLGTGVAVALARAGYPVTIVELARPKAVRRRVALAEAARTGRASVEGVRCRRQTLAALCRTGVRRGVLPLVVAPVREAVAALRPAVLVDARLAKKKLPFRVGNAVFHVALGPGHRAGADCDVVVETLRGPTLGRVIWRGAAAADTGVPGALGGVTAARVLRAPGRGVLRLHAAIGRSVRRGDVVARVGGRQVRAQVDGVVRGLLADGDRVVRGQKLGDVDPRPLPPPVDRISDKANRVGRGVLQALRAQFGGATLHPAATGPGGAKRRLHRARA